MAINYNLSIGNLNIKLSVGDLTNVVYEVSVGVNAISQEYPQFTYSCSGLVGFDISDLNSQSFIPFEDITQETVINWILQKEGVETIEEFSYVKYSIENIQNRIDELQQQDSVSVSWTVSNSVGSTPEVTEEVVDSTILEP